MIIKREYCTYGQLLADEPSRKMFFSVLEKYVDAEKARYLLEANDWVIVHNTDMGSCIPGEAYQEIRRELDRLDLEEPFDNGMDFRDVSSVFSIESHDGRKIMQFMICRKAEQPEYIVQVVAFKYGGDKKMHFIEPWDVGQVGL